MRRLVLVVLLLAAISPLESTAVASRTPSEEVQPRDVQDQEERPLSFMEVADGFAGCGYAVLGQGGQQGLYEELLVWDPDTPRVPNGDGRALLVDIYPDAESLYVVLVNRAQELAAIRREPAGAQLDPNQGPQLVTGTGGTVWRRNVVLMQQTTMLPSTDYLGREPRPRFRDAGPNPPYAVDSDFVACLDRIIQGG